ncbi:ABC transporter substrate-binding protein [Actinocrinis sp.]|uniref:ABC transporter substrate-binding protein n=1 Tax=Actinocrinis sp. TaxID=1920516 RepID=UPI002D709629|nr:ABC transporter substrate-binding protein [Actinocrinis sp.]HZP52523.1 ABC transporter substrate-binding protein [Actinocrinis sp.]
MNRIAKLASLAAGLALAATACGNSAPAASSGGSAADWSKATSASAGGGLDALVAAAKKEGQLNVITLPRTWANYGKIMDDFTKKYGIKITDANPDGSSGDEINALQHQKGLSSAPDVVDVGNSHALPYVSLFAPYKVQTWADIPDSLKDANGAWYGDYGGYITIACDASKISGASCPKTFADLANPANAAAYKGKVAINGDPTSANAAFSAVWAAALATGGTLDNIQPGIDFFAKLKSLGVFNATHSTESTIEQGSTPISIDWEFNNSQYAADLKAKGIDLTVTVPSDGLYSAYYDQAVNKFAPHPAAARLWEEYLYSTTGQNDFMGGYARPAEFTAMQSASTLDSADLANLPKVTGTPQFPSATQLTNAQNTVTAKWASALG